MKTSAALLMLVSLASIARGAEPIQWQYAEMTDRTWEGPEGHVIAQDNAELRIMLKAPPLPKNSSEITSLLNYVGAQGWELVTIRRDETTNHYVLKRIKPTKRD